MTRYTKNRRQMPDPYAGHIVNERIREREVRLITHRGENLGVILKSKALEMAQDEGLDLVVISKGDDTQPVAKIMDFGKFLYEKKKKQGEAKKHQKIIQVKEVKMRPNIGDQDYMIKMKKALKFLEDGKKVKFTLQFRGRQKSMMRDLGDPFFAKISKDLHEAEIGQLIEEKESKRGPFWSKIVALKT